MHTIWLYVRYNRSYRDVEELLTERRIIVMYETIRPWARMFGQSYANHLRRRQGWPGDAWFLDEVFLKITGKPHAL